MKQFKPSSTQSGFSVIEFLVATMLGLMIVSGVIQIFVSNQENAKYQNAIARIQESGRMMQKFIPEHVRPIAFLGCNLIANVTPFITANPYPANLVFSQNTVVWGADGASSNWTPTLPTWFNTALGGAAVVKPSTDVLIVLQSSSDPANLTANMASWSSPVTIQNRFTVTAGDVMMISDCASATIFTATGAALAGNVYTITHDVSKNSNASFNKVYQTDAQVAKLKSLSFYVKNSGRTNRSGDIIYSLYMLDETNRQLELVEGVENMKVSYGVDSDGDGSVDTYKTATNVNASAQWGQVVSISIAMLLSSVEPGVSSPQAYTFQGVTTTPTDNLIRREWNIYIDLRNI